MSELDDLTTVGGRELIASGSLIAVDDEEVRLREKGLAINFTFIQEDKGGQLLTFRVEDGALRVILKNWNNSLGTAIDTRIGAIDDRPLIMALVVHTVGTERIIRQITYTFSLGEKQA